MCYEILTKYKNEVDNDVRLLLTSSPQQAETGHIVRSSSAKALKIFSAFMVLYFNFKVFISGQFL